MNIIWSCPLDVSGYSQCGRDYTLCLDHIGCNVKYETPVVSSLLDGLGIDFELKNKLQTLIDKKFESAHVRVSHSVPDRFVIDKKATLNIGYTVVETEKIPDGWAFLCNKMDAIFTASAFCRDILVKNGVTVPVFVIPHCHNIKEYSEVNSYNIGNRKAFNFLFMADMTPRKGWKHLVKAYCESFSPEDNVSLTFKVYYHDFSEKSKQRCKNAIREVADVLGFQLNDNTAPFYFYGDCLPNKCIPRFINSFDAIVSPHSGEGWGLVCSQAMMLGKPVIATEYSGNLEFMNHDNSFLVPIKGFEKVPDDMVRINSNYANQEWAVIDPEELGHTMRQLYIDSHNAADIGIKGQQHMHKNFTYEPVGNQIKDAIEILLKMKETKK